MKKIAFEIDMAELAVRLAECVAGIKRPEGKTSQEALEQLREAHDPSARYVVACCEQQAVVCWEYVTECLNQTGHQVQ